MKTYEITYGHHTLRYHFHYDETFLYMCPYIRESESDDTAILSPIEYMEKLKPYYPENQDDAYVEYKSLINLSSLALLKEKAVFYHAVAFRYQGKAWLFTGKSGTGKTTQYMNWRRRFKEQVEMICGDMPCLEVDEKGKAFVYPSPWNGKERIQGKTSAELGGIILLEKSDYNEISEISISEALVPFFYQFAVEPRNEEDIRHLADIADIILSRYPVMKLYNKADEEAVTLCSGYLEKFL